MDDAVRNPMHRIGQQDSDPCDALMCSRKSVGLVKREAAKKRLRDVIGGRSVDATVGARRSPATPNTIANTSVVTVRTLCASAMTHCKSVCKREQ